MNHWHYGARHTKFYTWVDHKNTNTITKQNILLYVNDYTHANSVKL